MYCRILHEARGRLRVHVKQCYMTLEEADLLETYLKELPHVRSAKVNERTANATLLYSAEDMDGAREDIIRALAEFHYDDCSVVPPEHTGRALRHEYEDKIALQIIKRAFSKLFLPLPVRTVITAVKSVPYFYEGAKSLLNGRLEVSVLDAASIGVSMLRSEFDTAGSVMFLLSIGDTMDEWTHKKTIDDLAGVMSLNVDKVWTRCESGEEVLRKVDEIATGDLIVVRAGNLIPLDGDVFLGDAMVNQSSMTGEPLPVHKREGAYVYAGSVIEDGELVVRVRQENENSRYNRIVAMIEESEKLKSSAEDKASRLADKLVPWTFLATGLTWLITGNSARAASILMVDFCCALKLSMPIAVLSAMREAGDHHISVKGGKFIEAFAEANTIVFDKTGTLTNASPYVHKVVAFGGNDETEMLRIAACLEEHFPHSMANAVVREAGIRGIIHEEKHSKVEYIVAHGIASSIDGEKIRIGSYHFIFEDEGCVVPEDEKEKFDSLPDEYSHLYMAIEGVLCAVILIEDPIKEEAADVIAELRELGFDRIVMMTGDSERTARAVAARVGVDEYHSEVLPEDKAGFIASEHEAGRKVVMIGDGINDSPALSAADAGVAINSGAAIAQEIADITISEDDLYSLVILRKLSLSLLDRIDLNYRNIVGFNSLLIILGMFGILPSSATALLHNASTVAIGLRSMSDLLKNDES